MKKFALFLAPLMAISFLTNCSSGPKLYTVTFDLNGGTSEAIPTQTVKEGEKATEPKDPSRAEDEQGIYAFKEWQLNGNTFDFKAPITESITLKANWNIIHKYTVTFDPNGGKWADGSTDYKVITVNEGEKVAKPDKNPSREDEQAIYTFNEWQLDGNKFDFSAPINKNLTLKADWNIAHKYSVTVGTCSHLSFTTTDGKDFSVIKAIEGEDFTFKMKAINDEGSTDYLVPSFINITVNGMMLEPTSCPITRISNFEANVTIKGSKITGDIVISGFAALKDHYTYQFFAHDGLKDIPSGSQTTDKDITLTLEPLDGYEKPKAENILILFDNVPGENPRQWVSPAEDLPDISDYCTYEESESAGTLTIKHKYIKNNICIVTRAHNFKLLESLSWDKINQYSLAGWAPYIFYIGEEKTIKVNEIDHKVRIIDFNHDELSTSTEEKKQFAGITFEFANLLSDSSGYSLATLWNTSNKDSSTNYDYLNSDLRKALDGQGTGTLRWYQKESGTKSTNYTTSVYDMLPSGLQSKIRTVKKEVATTSSYTVTNYDTKIFALTFREMTQRPRTYAKEEGTTYQYYKEHDNDSSRIKHQIKWHDGAVTSSTKITDSDITWEAYNCAGYNASKDSYGGYYWLASPSTYGSGIAWCVRDGGYLLDNRYVYSSAFAVAPAFCI